MNIIISYHFYLVIGLLGIMVLNLSLPAIYKIDHERLVLYTRIGYFAFWALWSMVLFSGLIVLVFMRLKMGWSVWLMLLLSAVLPLLDGFRAIKMKKLWQDDRSADSFSGRIVLSEIILTMSVVGIALRG